MASRMLFRLSLCLGLLYVRLTNGTPSSSLAVYDYVVVGGGTSGLVIANRLSEDPSITVAVIEAGVSQFNNPNVTNTTTFGLGLGTQIDWQYISVPQKFALNETQEYHAGKALGGTSTINGITYLRAETVQIDAWESFGNPGWNWASLYPYYKKSEHFIPPNPLQVAEGAAFNPDFHGFDGHLAVGWQAGTPDNGSSTTIINETWAALGMPYNKDANGGHMRGFTVYPFTVNATTSIREDAARAYYFPVQGRKNLHAFVNTTATKLIWQDSDETTALKKGQSLTAEGVQVILSTGDVATVKAKKEIVLSLGSLRTPPLLEYSGVGNPAILDKYSIPVRIPLPGVGENMQDQTNTPIGSETNPDGPDFIGYPPYVTYTTARDLFGTNLSSVEATVRASIPSYAAQNVATSSNATTLAIQEHLLTLQADLIFNNSDTLPIAELLTDVGFAPGIIVLPFWLLLPFGRGNVHISNADPLNGNAPAINPNFFMNAFDGAVQVAAARLQQRALETAPLSNSVGAQILPPPGAVPANATDAEWLAWLKSAYAPNWHAVGTASMMSRELGGVVDSELRLYGATNVRIVDASVLPAQVCGHLTATLYALAERAADIIKASK